MPGLSRERTKACTFGHEARLQEPPQRHDDLSGDGDDRNSSDTSLGVADAFTEPLADGAVGLVHQPKPGELDGMMPDDGVASLADPLVALS